MLKAWSECPATSDGRGPQPEWPHTEAVQCHWHTGSDWHSDCPWSKLSLRLWPGLLTVPPYLIKGLGSGQVSNQTRPDWDSDIMLIT